MSKESILMAVVCLVHLLCYDCFFHAQLCTDFLFHQSLCKVPSSGKVQFSVLLVFHQKLNIFEGENEMFLSLKEYHYAQVLTENSLQESIFFKATPRFLSSALVPYRAPAAPALFSVTVRLSAVRDHGEGHSQKCCYLLLQKELCTYWFHPKQAPRSCRGAWDLYHR